jgi:molybdopterin-guanine dinucleotide biosynthesis protein A
MVNAVVLGGGGEDVRLAGFYEGPSKGLIELAGRSCLHYVLTALRETPDLGRIALAGPQAVLSHSDAAMADVCLPGDLSIVEKLTAAAKAFDDGRRLLMVTSDIPLATGTTYADTIARCPSDAALFHPLVAKAAALRDFPQHTWFFLKLREGEVVTTNVLIIDPDVLLQRPDLAAMLEDLRRHPIRLALRFGLGFLLKLKLGLLRLDACERFFSEFLGAPVRCAITEHTDLAMDLDRPEDAPMLEARLASRTV